MKGTRVEYAKKALTLFVKSLPQDSIYNIYTFGSKYEKFFKEPVKISEDNVRTTIEKINKLTGTMGSTFLN